jgi:hypothetical protein
VASVPTPTNAAMTGFFEKLAQNPKYVAGGVAGGAGQVVEVHSGAG